MPGGGLRILPSKSWNVWRRDNIDRVRADEAAAEQNQAALQERTEAAEAEWRLDQLRAAAASLPEGDGGTARSAADGAARSTEGSRPAGHINLFELEEQAARAAGARPARAAA